ncbi:MAG: DUF4136 domain-containing protein [Marinilabiliales bacterium]|nr:MAG: DUF4136 domain-containing protein [Marinilabiliales bacterium]
MKNILIVSILLALISSCNTVKVTNNFDKDVNFKEFSTFSFYPWDKHNDEIISEYDKNLILNSIKSTMEKKGYVYKEEKGDLIISTFVLLQEKTMNQAYTNHYGGWAGYGSGWDYGATWSYGYGYWGGPAYTTSTITSRDYVEGTLIFDVFRLDQKKLVWQGVGVGEVNPDFNKRDKNLPKAISHIFRRFPTAAKK